MFCDEVTVTFIAGKGGNGCIAFRREKFVPRGGPSGGEGGKGGSIYLEANENVNTLAEFNTYKTFRAEPGEKGLGKEMGGLDASDLILPVPVGTMIYDEKKKKLLGDLQRTGERFLIARGGKGGFGNVHFKSSTRQAPTFAELGEPGEKRTCTLELQLVADVGFIGLPSVGKSTLISCVSNARPKIAEYHFTTLIPNLGFVTLQQFGGSPQQNFLACDLPGLIEGAHEGKGLGIQFLKHVTRNRILVHLLDVNSPDPANDYRVIMKELKAFNPTLAKKPQIIAFNKIETKTKEEVDDLVKSFRKKHPKAKKIYLISCATHAGLKELVFAMWNLLEKEKRPEPPPMPKENDVPGEEEFKVYRPDAEEDTRSYHIELVWSGKKKKTFRVTGRRIEQIVVMTDFTNHEAIARVYDVLEKMQINRGLRREGAHFGDTILVGEQKIIYRWE